ncbi:MULTISPECIES: helix-turn-helix domain-containing protein [Protofrankia]|uniref:XRE family transcriptional regulator n=1 Tax=Protofrankia coriariae TaxID=1562887 RepID=A0ABR5F2A5_9ACTN|nr:MULTISPECIES: helix-turn-helix domain-containing protein [Protofrankia]KLL10837.1 XRE family transcriptional regulator [Protofrankia coriariae]ONH34045.1 transcriptional regulator [Protofrankia sp. BMG5.30]
MPSTTGPYTVSPQLLDRDDMRAALHARDFATIFRLLKKYDGASQDRIASPVDGLTQSRVSRIMRGQERIVSIDLIERIADALRIPGAALRLAPRPWEEVTSTGTVPAQPPAVSAPVHETPPAAPSGDEPPRGAEDHSLTVDLDIAVDGWATITYRHDLFNPGPRPLTRLARELWFENTRGPLALTALPSDGHNVIIQRIHDTPSMAKFACQIFPAIQPGASASVGYTCEGGQFVSDHYWRQSITRPTGILTIRLRHRGAASLTRCTAAEEYADGYEVTATDSLTVTSDGTDIIIELVRRDLGPGQAVTLRWDVTRAPA